MQAVKGISLFTGSVLVLVLFASLLGIRVELPEAAYAKTGVEYKSVYVPATVIDGKAGSGWKQVDEKELHKELQVALSKLSYEGFEVVEVTPILKGRLESGSVRNDAWASGYSVTQGLMVLAMKPAE